MLYFQNERIFVQLFTYRSFVLSFLHLFCLFKIYFFGKTWSCFPSALFQAYPLLFQMYSFSSTVCPAWRNLTTCGYEMVVLFYTCTCLYVPQRVHDVTLLLFCWFLSECVTRNEFPPELVNLISFLLFSEHQEHFHLL